MYGLSRDAIEDVAREGLACCVHMELEVRMEGGKGGFQADVIKDALSNCCKLCAAAGCAQPEEELL